MLVHDLSHLTVITNNNNNLRQVAKIDKQDLRVMISASNPSQAHDVVQISGEALTAIADSLQLLPPEIVAELSGPLIELIRAAGVAVGKVR